MPSHKSAWDTIANYEASDIVRARYQAKHTWQPNAAHSREISSPFTQARHYFESAKNADKTVKPLLMYYGVTSLSRGLVLFLTRKQRSSQLTPSHGLSILDWQSVLSKSNPNFEDLKITVNSSGSFTDILRATDNRGLLRVGSSAVNHKTSEGIVTKGSIITFGELLTRLPELIGQLQFWQTPLCVPVQVEKISGSQESSITISRWVGAYVKEDLVIDIVGSGHCELVSVDNTCIIVRTKMDGTTSASITDLILTNSLGIGDLYLAKRYDSGAKLGKIAQLFAVSYILGMLVRYFPMSWSDLIHQRIDASALPTIFRVIDCIEILYPQIVVDFLEET